MSHVQTVMHQNDNRLAREGRGPFFNFLASSSSSLLALLALLKLGLYECPVPYHRLLSPELLEWCAQSERFFFLKETSCDLEQIRLKVTTVQGTLSKFITPTALPIWVLCKWAHIATAAF